MASKSEHRKQKNAEKKKLRDRDRRAAAARVRAVTKQVRSADPAEVAGWPLADCYISQNWADQGPRLHAILTRKHASGSFGAALFEIDLAGEGVVSASAMVGVEQGMLYAELEKRSQPNALLIVDPGLVVKAVQEGLRLGGNELEELDEAMVLLGDVAPAPQEFLVGTLEAKQASAPQEEEPTGFFANLRRRFGI